MRTRLLATILSITISLASCTPAGTSVPLTVTSGPLTVTPVPTATAIPPTEHPHILLQQDAFLYNGPGNADFDLIATLKAGEIVYPIAAYVDFVQVATKVSGNDVTGFIERNTLSNLPGNLPVLTPDSVPVKPLFHPECTKLYFDFDRKIGLITVENQGNDYKNVELTATAFDAPLRIRIDTTGSDVNASGTINIVGVPGNSNPWWKGTLMMSIYGQNGSYAFFIRDGTSDKPSYFSGDLGLKTSKPIQLIFDQTEGKSFVILDGNDHQLRRVDLTQLPGLNLPKGLFPEKRVEVDLTVSPRSTLAISGLQVGTVPQGVWVASANRFPGLAELASKHNLTIGTEYNPDSASDLNYCQTMMRNFNVAVLTGFSWKGIWLGPDQYNFEGLDSDVNIASQTGSRLRASHLVWGARESAIPDWLLHSHFTRDQYIELLEKYVKTVVTRYKGRVQEWSIANEYVSRSFYGTGDFWNEKIGPEYVEMAFRWAREADPNGILIFNDGNNESPRDQITSRTIEEMYNTVKDLKAKGVPIDVVGMHMNLLDRNSGSPIPPKKEDVIATMRKFGDLGVKIYITEFHIGLHYVPGTPEEKLQYQAGLYKDMLEACLESGVCESFTTWGISDAESEITKVCPDPWCGNQPDAAPLMFDKDYNPKPAYFAVQDVLLDFPPPSMP